MHAIFRKLFLFMGDMFMENILNKKYSYIDKLFDLMEKACSFCFDKLSMVLNHAYAWAIVISIGLLLVFNIINIVR